jgi:hypothetical protein
MLEKTEKKIKSENRYKEKKVGGFDIVRYEGQVILYKGLDQYVLEKDIAQAIGAKNTGHLNTLYKTGVRNGTFDLDKDRIILSSNASKFVRQLLHRKNTGRPFAVVKYAKALQLVSNSNSELRHIASEELYNLAEVGSRALRYAQLRKSNPEKVSEKEFYDQLFKLALDEYEYPLFLKRTYRSKNPYTQVSRKCVKEINGIENNHPVVYSVDEVKRNNQITRLEIKQMLNEALEIIS